MFDCCDEERCILLFFFSNFCCCYCGSCLFWKCFHFDADIDFYLYFIPAYVPHNPMIEIIFILPGFQFIYHLFSYRYKIIGILLFVCKYYKFYVVHIFTWEFFYCLLIVFPHEMECAAIIKWLHVKFSQFHRQTYINT